MPTRSSVPAQTSQTRRVYSVTEITGEVKRLLEASYPGVWVEGELADVSKPRSGHVYFSLKDGPAGQQSGARAAGGTLSCAWFKNRQGRGRLDIDNGQRVLVRGRLTVYEPSGRFQMIVEHLEDAGEGALRRAFEQLKSKLDGEGLFDQDRKRPLPTLPRRVAVITSLSGAVLHDVATTFARRFAAIKLRVYPVSVQGETAASEIARALTVANERRDCDAIIVCRGGGSLQDLFAFNEEVVARAIAASTLPVVAAVGHETDVSIADFVADARAPTPTAAAELLSPDAEEYRAAFSRFAQTMTRLAQQTINHYGQRVDMTTRRLVHPMQRVEHARRLLNGRRRELLLQARAHINTRRGAIDRLSRRLTEQAPNRRVAVYLNESRHLHQRLRRAMSSYTTTHQQRIGALVSRLNTASPMATLNRGYAIVEDADSGRVLQTIDDVKPGQTTRTRLANGELRSTVNKVTNNQS